MTKYQHFKDTLSTTTKGILSTHHGGFSRPCSIVDKSTLTELFQVADWPVVEFLGVLYLPMYTYLRNNARSLVSNNHGFLHHEVGDAHMLEVVHIAPTDSHGSHLNVSRIIPDIFSVYEISGNIRENEATTF